MKRRKLIVISISALAVLLVIRPVYEFGKVIIALKRARRATEHRVSSLGSERLQKLISDSERLASETRDQQVFVRGRDDGIPVEFSDLDPSFVSIKPDRVQIQLMGSFDAFGIEVMKDASGSGAWQAYRYYRYDDDISLLELIVPNTGHP